MRPQEAAGRFDDDVLSLEVDLAEVTAEMPALVRLDPVREVSESERADVVRTSDGASRPGASPAVGETYGGLLRQAAQVLRADVDAGEMLRALFHDIREPVGVDAYFNFMVNEAGDALSLASYAGVTDDDTRSFERIEFGQAVCGNVALKRAPVSMSGIQASSDRRVQFVKHLGIRAVACNPLIMGDRLLGTLSFASRTRDEFGAEELAFFGSVARAVALSHERSRLARELAVVESELDALGRSVYAALSAPAAGAVVAVPGAAAVSAEPILTGAASAALLEAMPAARSESVPAALSEDVPVVLSESVPAALSEDVPVVLSEQAPVAAAEVETFDSGDEAAVAIAPSAAFEATPTMADIASFAPFETTAALKVASSTPIEATPVASAEPTTLPAAAVTPFDLIEATRVGAEVIPFARYAAAAVAAADVPLGLIEAAPVTALEVSPLAPIDVSASDGPRAEHAAADDSFAPSAGAPLLAGDPPVLEHSGTTVAQALHADAPAAPVADIDVLSVDAATAFAVPAVELPSPDAAEAVAPATAARSGDHSHPSVAEEAQRDELLALALAATDATTLEVLALALTVDDPPHHESPPVDAKVESEITVELCALDLNTVRMPTLDTLALDLSATEISALDLRPVETVDAPPRKMPRAAPQAPDVVDDEAPTVEMKALAIQELEAERAPTDDGDDITFIYVPPS